VERKTGKFNLDRLEEAVIAEGMPAWLIPPQEFERIEEEGIRKVGFGLAYTHVHGPNLVVEVNGLFLKAPLTSPEVVEGLLKGRVILICNEEGEEKRALEVELPPEAVGYVAGVRDALYLIRREAEKITAGG
jgi:hypothetical protein